MTRWLQQRATGSGAPSAGPAGVADPAAAARRVVARAERVTAGLDDLDLWLRDQIRTGVAGLERAGYRQFEQVAARLVDAQAPGVASMVRGIPAEFTGDGWPERVLLRLAALHLLVEAHRRLDELPAELAANVRSRVGYPLTRAQVLAGPGVQDRWLALGLVDTVEFQLQTRRVWLHGTSTGRWALWLTFAVPGAPLDATVLPGQHIDAALHFYPGSAYRALIGATGADTVGPSISGEVADGTLTDAQRRWSALLALDPWATRLPAAVTGSPIRPEAAGAPWKLRDVEGYCVDLIGPDEPWLMLARSGGEPIGVFGEWGTRGFLPLSLLPDPWNSLSTRSTR